MNFNNIVLRAHNVRVDTNFCIFKNINFRHYLKLRFWFLYWIHFVFIFINRPRSLNEPNYSLFILFLFIQHNFIFTLSLFLINLINHCLPITRQHIRRCPIMQRVSITHMKICFLLWTHIFLVFNQFLLEVLVGSLVARFKSILNCI